MTEDSHHVRQRNDCVHSVLDEHIFIGTIQILARTNLKVKRRRLVDCILHLIDMPVSTKERSIDDTYVRAHILDLLCIPERECIIITMSHKNTVMSH